MRNLLVVMYTATGMFLLIYGCRNTMTEMSGGQRLYSAKCTSCHNLIAPQKYSKEEWLYYVDKYGEKLATEEKQIIFEYLTR